MSPLGRNPEPSQSSSIAASRETRVAYVETIGLRPTDGWPFGAVIIAAVAMPFLLPAAATNSLYSSLQAMGIGSDCDVLSAGQRSISLSGWLGCLSAIAVAIAAAAANYIAASRNEKARALGFTPRTSLVFCGLLVACGLLIVAPPFRQQPGVCIEATRTLLVLLMKSAVCAVLALVAGRNLAILTRYPQP